MERERVGLFSPHRQGIVRRRLSLRRSTLQADSSLEGQGNDRRSLTISFSESLIHRAATLPLGVIRDALVARR